MRSRPESLLEMQLYKIHIAQHLKNGEAITSDQIRARAAQTQLSRPAIANMICKSIKNGTFRDFTGIEGRIFKVETSLVLVDGSYDLYDTNFHLQVEAIRSRLSRPSELVQQIFPTPAIKTYRLEQVDANPTHTSNNEFEDEAHTRRA